MDKAQLKAQGLTFGRSVQTAFKAVVMDSVDHPAAGKAVEQAYDALRNLLQLAPQFAFGFSDHRVLLNDLLTEDPLLGQQQGEFARRGFTALTFLGGIGLAEFRQALRVLRRAPDGKEILALAGKATEAALLQQTADPREVVAALAQLLRQVPPEHLLSALPIGKQAELRGRPADDVAANVVEDATVAWVSTPLAAAPTGPSVAAAEGEAIRVTMVGLSMTQMADRVLETLARTLDEAHLPADTYRRIRQGVLWGGLSEGERREWLLQATEYIAVHGKAG